MNTPAGGGEGRGGRGGGGDGTGSGWEGGRIEAAVFTTQLRKRGEGASALIVYEACKTVFIPIILVMLMLLEIVSSSASSQLCCLLGLMFLEQFLPGIWSPFTQLL